MKENRFEDGVKTFGVADDGVKWVYDDRNKALVPDAVKAKVDSLRARIIRGEITAPTEP